MSESTIVRICLVGLGIAMAQTWTLAAQTAPGVERPATTQPASAAQGGQNPDDALKIFRAPLLREGSNLVQIKSTASRDAASGAWKLLIDPGNSGNADSPPRYELNLLPCSRLAEMQRIIESSPDHRVTFQVSGEVLVFRGRNYLLPTYAPVLTEEIVLEPITATQPDVQPARSATSMPAREGGSPPATTAPSDQSAQDISHDLEKAAGPLRRSGGARATGNRSHDAADSDPDATSATRPAHNSDRRSTSAASSGHPEKLLREGTMLTTRRGKLSRDGSGGWIFVFDADASGLADPPVRLLPCMLLERIEDYARRVGNNSPALLSGPIYLYAGRNYLLPTVFRIPQDRRNLTP